MTVTVEAQDEACKERRARFRAALALARLIAKDWASQQGEKGITETHLYAVLKGGHVKGGRDSAPLTAAIDAFIAEWLPPAPKSGRARMVANER